MSEYFGYGVFLLLFGLWLRASWREDDLFGKDDDGYADPAMPRLVETPSSAEVSDDPAGDVAAVVTAEEWHGTTRISLARVNGQPVGNARRV